MQSSSTQILARLQGDIGHQFRDPRLLIQAVAPLLGQGSLGREVVFRVPANQTVTLPSYQQLEFLGDRVLGLVIAHWLMEKFSSESEGHLTDRLAALVEHKALQEIITRNLGLGYLLPPGNPNAKNKVLSDICESLIGAIYLDAGLEKATTFIRNHWSCLLERQQHPPKSAKTMLQEWTQGQGKGLPVYRKLAQLGEDHRPLFEVQVEVRGEEPVTGSSGSIRQAETVAAQRMLERFHNRAES